jgi:di/tricarboxylate transporter
MAESTITFLVLGCAVVLFITNRIPVALVAMGVALSLWATGILELEEALSGFGSPTVLFIAAMFVVADALDATGVTAWVGQLMLDRGGSNRSRLVALVMVVCALVTAAVTPNASVAALVPAVVIIAIRVRLPSSQLLMPLAFGAHAGALLALTGSPVNVLVGQAADDAGIGAFGFFEYALTGIPLLVGTVVLAVVLTPKVLPHRNARTMPPDFSSLAGSLARDYGLDDPAELYDRHHGVAELIVPPRSALVGQTMFPGMVTESGDLVVLGVRRAREELRPGTVTLKAGDALLVRGTWRALSIHLPDDDALTVNPPDLVRRQVVPLSTGAKEALAVLGVMVVLLATGALPPAVASLLAAGALILLRVIDLDQAYAAVSWSTVLLVAGMIPLSIAMQTTGAAQKLADALVDIVGDGGPYALVAGLFVLVAVLGQLISNTATALIVIPIALSSAAEMDVSPRPVLMAVNVAAAAALLTPVATPANMMVMEPGGYGFGDYWKLGLPVLAWFAVISIGVVPLIWRF